MTSTRLGAAIAVLLLIGILAFAGVAVTAWLGPMSAHGTNVMHVGGKITTLVPGKSFTFTFETNTNVAMTFMCSVGCRASLRHVQRHLKEKAPTDVYYVNVEGPTGALLVKDVD